MNDEHQKRLNHRVLSRFEAHWRRKGVLADYQFFNCEVRMRYSGHDRRVVTQAQILPSNHVYIMDAQWFNSIDHYAEFNPDFQIFKLTKLRRALRIEGAGDKLRGRYRYDIRPLR
jgi:hypothetical protein